MLKKQKSNLKSLICILSLTLFSVKLFASQNLSDEEYDKFILGKSFFTIPWVASPSSTTARDGLGPLFNANTCITCHPSNQRGELFTNEGLTSRALVAKLSNHTNLIDRLKDPIYGSQISINGTQNTKFEANIKLDFEKIKVELFDKETVELLKPKYKLENTNYGALHKNTNVSYFIAPSLIGIGLIEKIPKEQILKNVDENDANNDGISGKANYVYSYLTKKYELGIYNHKASVAYLKEQVAKAANEDMGLTSSIYPIDNCTKFQENCIKESKLSKQIDIPDVRIEAISFYIENLEPKNLNFDKEYKEGLKIFENLQCIKCHVSSYTLENGKKIFPFSDFLLHDMGFELSDGRVEYNALQSEFKTAPLWNLDKNRKNLLHDGRARNIQEAILWHGGEALNAKQNYMKLEKKQREKLIKFLEKL